MTPKPVQKKRNLAKVVESDSQVESEDIGHLQTETDSEDSSSLTETEADHFETPKALKKKATPTACSEDNIYESESNQQGNSSEYETDTQKRGVGKRSTDREGSNTLAFIDLEARCVEVAKEEVC